MAATRNLNSNCPVDATPDQDSLPHTMKSAIQSTLAMCIKMWEAFARRIIQAFTPVDQSVHPSNPLAELISVDSWHNVTSEDSSKRYIVHLPRKYSGPDRTIKLGIHHHKVKDGRLHDFHEGIRRGDYSEIMNISAQQSIRLRIC
ncbi:hypothetical protein E4T56_gene16764 [Termitomyces sp. T112]|nr:hypothetical protein E4T56_gene16764 [Termitomyces sp. T112]